MRILMLGNSFTFANNMPKTLANLIDAEVVQHTRGGARLAEQLNPDTKMGGMTQAALENEKWDYVILQEMSNGPITSRESFLKNTALLCERIRSNGAVPVLYATWAYQKGGKQLESFGMDYDEMYQKMYDACEQNGAQMAICSYRQWGEGAEKMNPTGNVLVLSKMEAMELYIMGDKQYHIYNSVWSKLFLRSLIDNLRFQEGHKSEDIMYTT